jgi:hypothetical protein
MVLDPRSLKLTGTALDKTIKVLALYRKLGRISLDKNIMCSNLRKTYALIKDVF